MENVGDLSNPQLSNTLAAGVTGTTSTSENPDAIGKTLTRASNQNIWPKLMEEPEAPSLTAHALVPYHEVKEGEQACDITDRYFADYLNHQRSLAEPFRQPRVFREVKLRREQIKSLRGLALRLNGATLKDCEFVGRLPATPGSEVRNCIVRQEKLPMYCENFDFNYFTPRWMGTTIDGGYFNSWLNKITPGLIKSPNLNFFNISTGALRNLIIDLAAIRPIGDANFSAVKMHNVVFSCAEANTGETVTLRNCTFREIDAENISFEGINFDRNIDFTDAKIKNLLLSEKVCFTGANFGKDYQQGSITLSDDMFDTPEKIKQYLENNDNNRAMIYGYFDSLTNDKLNQDNNIAVRRDWAGQLVEKCRRLPLLNQMFNDNRQLRESIMLELSRDHYKDSGDIQKFLREATKKHIQVATTEPLNPAAAHSTADALATEPLTVPLTLINSGTEFLKYLSQQVAAETPFLQPKKFNGLLFTSNLFASCYSMATRLVAGAKVMVQRKKAVAVKWHHCHFTNCRFDQMLKLPAKSEMINCTFEQQGQQPPMDWKNVELGLISKQWPETRINGSGLNRDRIVVNGVFYNVGLSDINMSNSDIKNIAFIYEENSVIKEANLTDTHFDNVIFSCDNSDDGATLKLMAVNLNGIKAEKLTLDGVDFRSANLENTEINDLVLINNVDFSGANFGENYRSRSVILSDEMFNTPERVQYHLVNSPDKITSFYKMLSTLTPVNNKVRVDFIEQLVEKINSDGLLRKMFLDDVNYPQFRASLLSELKNECYQNSAAINQFIEKVDGASGPKETTLLPKPEPLSRLRSFAVARIKKYLAFHQVTSSRFISFLIDKAESVDKIPPQVITQATIKGELLKNNIRGPIKFEGDQFHDLIIEKDAALPPDSVMRNCTFIFKQRMLWWRKFRMADISKDWTKSNIKGSYNGKTKGIASSVDFSDINISNSIISDVAFGYLADEVIQNMQMVKSKLNNVTFFSDEAEKGSTMKFNQVDLQGLKAEKLKLQGVVFEKVNLEGASIEGLILRHKVDFRGARFGDYQKRAIRLDDVIFSDDKLIDQSLNSKLSPRGSTDFWDMLDSLTGENNPVRVDFAEQLVEISLAEKPHTRQITPLGLRIKQDALLRQSIINELSKQCYEESRSIRDFLQRIEQQYQQQPESFSEA